jgi:1,4-dihydroxy-2-naphthoyl-CoA synthase
VSYQTLQIEQRAGALGIWINRPEVRNAFNDAMIAELPKEDKGQSGGGGMGGMGGMGDMDM